MIRFNVIYIEVCILLVEMPSLHTWNEAEQERCSVYIEINESLLSLLKLYD